MTDGRTLLIVDDDEVFRGRLVRAMRDRGFEAVGVGDHAAAITAAQADLLNAEREVQRVELELRTRLTESYAAYLNALGMTARYQRDILPRAQQAYDMYLTKFRQMAAAYPQVLIAQRTLFEARSEAIAAQVELWQSVAQLRGLLLMGGLNAPAAMMPVSGSR